ncbi:hypothetical protein F4802DRAFT_602441 [Xylaria palmicola]|nr:hypothetical protein F4802DRAFT_602441 [Xylaria palmicola]
MAKWQSDSNEEKPVCLDTITASEKCGRCKRHNKACISPTGVLKARGVELARIFAADDLNTTAQPVVDAQLSVRHALQQKKNHAGLSASAAAAVNAKAATERHERQLLALERTAAAFERTAAAFENTARILEDIRVSAKD